MSGLGGGFLLGGGASSGRGGFGGGGNYGNESVQNSATKNANSTSPYKGGQDKKKGSIIPLTIKKLLEASNGVDDVVEVDGAPVEQAVIIGRVYKMEEQSTRIILHMDDSTGRIQVAYYKKSDTQSATGLDKFRYDENMYVKAVVVVRPFKTQKMFVSNMLQPVDDYNQISYHFLSTFLASAYRKKGPLPKSDPNVGSTQNNQQQNMFGGQAGNNPVVSMNRNNSKDPYTMVKDAIGQIQNQTANAVCKQSQLLNALRGKIDPNSLQYYLNYDLPKLFRECLMRLENNGEIYRDENHMDPGFMLLGN